MEGIVTFVYFYHPKFITVFRLIIKYIYYTI